MLGDGGRVSVSMNYQCVVRCEVCIDYTGQEVRTGEFHLLDPRIQLYNEIDVMRCDSDRHLTHLSGVVFMNLIGSE